MALVGRINSNFGFVLNTLYCKCMISIKKFVTEHNVMRYSNQVGKNKRKSYESFEQMLKFRQNEANRCILVKLSNMDHISDLEKFCQNYVNVVNTFPYYTVNDTKFVLMELQSAKDVQTLRNVAGFKTEVACAEARTQLFQFKPRSKGHLNNSNESRNNITLYSNFQAPKLSEIKKSLAQVDSVSDQMVALYNVLKITDLNIRLRFFTAHEISYYLSKLFSNIHVIPFGSSVNGFGQIGCDLDLLCKIVNIGETSKWRSFCFISQIIPLAERKEQKQFLEVVNTVMKLCIPGITNTKKILEARVPIIKFFNWNTNMKCDLSSTNPIALQMAELLYIYGQLDWRIKPLVCTIRRWARLLNLTKENPGPWITNFSLTLLIIFYLQTKDILPSMDTVMFFIELSESKSKAIDSNFNWFVSWEKSIKRTNHESLGDLLFDFFQYYSIFDFRTQAICIKDGKLKSKTDYSPLYIHNPFDITLNVSKNVNLVELTRLVDYFHKAYNIMLNSSERNIILKLFSLEPQTQNFFNNQETQIELEEKLLPTVTNINDSKTIQRNIIK